MNAKIIGISRHRIGVDGPGVTTLVAFHGCTLSCKYCFGICGYNALWRRYSWCFGLRNSLAKMMDETATEKSRFQIKEISQSI